MGQNGSNGTLRGNEGFRHVGPRFRTKRATVVGQGAGNYGAQGYTLAKTIVHGLLVLMT